MACARANKYNGPVATQGFDDALSFDVADTNIAIDPNRTCQIAFTGDDSADHGQTACPGQRADDFVQFDIHPFQRFLHVLDMSGGRRDVVPAKAQIVLQTADIGRGNKARPQQAMCMQRGAPLAVFHIGLPRRKSARLATIDHDHLHARRASRTP